MLKPLVTLVTLLFAFDSLSQQQKIQDSVNIVSFVGQIIIKANLDTQTDSYKVENSTGDRLNLFANSQNRLTLSLDYEFIGVSAGFAPKFLPGNNDEDLQGKSSFTNYEFRFFIGKWTQKLNYAKVRGFYLENTEDFIPDWIEGEDPYLQFPSFQTITWGGSTSYVLNPNFSLRNVVYNTEWQLKSAGSFIPTFQYGYTRISNKIDDFESYQDDFDMHLASSYYYTFVLQKKWFAAVFLSPSFGIRLSTEVDEEFNTRENYTYWPLALDGGLQLGYSSRKVIFGANFNFESTWYVDNESTNVLNDKVFAKIYIGYRLDPPTFIKKTFTSINDKLGL